MRMYGSSTRSRPAAGLAINRLESLKYGRDGQ